MDAPGTLTILLTVAVLVGSAAMLFLLLRALSGGDRDRPAHMRKLAEQLGIPFVARDFQVHDVVNADEAFESTTPFCIAPVTRINGIPIGDGKPGPITNRLLEAWNGLVGLDIVEQFRRAKGA